MKKQHKLADNSCATFIVNYSANRTPSVANLQSANPTIFAQMMQVETPPPPKRR